MRIAQVAPLHEAVPPKLYGGTERVVSYLTEQLVDMGHEVTLFASGDSITSARLVACRGEALRLSHCADPVMFHILQLEQIIREARDFDVIHFHTDYIHYCWARRSPVPTLTTLHGRQDLPQLIPLYKEFRDVPLSSISDAQRAPLPWVDWRGTIYHGLPESLLSFTARPEGYLAFLGRVSPEKRLDRAIAIAKRVGRPLKIAAKVDHADQDYFNTMIRPELDHPLIGFVGEIGECDKSAFLGNAAALLFPIDWPEPFGLVMIEAMACGTPVIAFRCGSVPEVVDEGTTGFIVDTLDQAVAAVEHAAALDRQACRQCFVERFSARRMATDYLALYRKLTRSRPALVPVAWQ